MRKDPPRATPEGETVGPRIAGLSVRWLPPIEDARGEVVELFRPEWGFHPAPMVYLYRVLVRPGAVKGWVKHAAQDDRIMVVDGTLTWAFYDDRPESPTRGLLNVLTFSERRRALFVIPQGVWHAVHNPGGTDAAFLNLPTRPYDHADPDKYRLPLENDLIPFSFIGVNVG